MPAELWALAFQQLLRQAPDGEWGNIFSRDTPKLALAVQLASVCRLWRQAAAIAGHSTPQLEHLCAFDAAQGYLSPLLAELGAGRRTLLLSDVALTGPTGVTYLELARPGELRVYNSAVGCTDPGATLARCLSLRRLSCSAGLLPSAFPPRLQALHVELPMGQRSQDGALACRQQTSVLLSSLQALPELAELSLQYQTSSSLPEHALQLPPALRSLNFSFEYRFRDSVGSLAALQQAAAQGIKVALQVRLWEELYEEFSSADMGRLWAALAHLPKSAKLKLSAWAESSFGMLLRDEQAESSEYPELSLPKQLCCKELILNGMFSLQYFGQLLCTVRAETAIYHRSVSYRTWDPLPWSWLILRPCVCIIELAPSEHSCSSKDNAPGLTVSDCPGSLPDFAQPWALVLRHSHLGFLAGVPLAEFEPGPRECLVWRMAQQRSHRRSARSSAGQSVSEQVQ